MQVTQISPMTGKENTKEIDCTLEQFTLWQNGAHIQDVMPKLSPADREFLISGSTQEDWDAMFPEEENEG